MHARYTVQIEPQPYGELGFLVTCRDLPFLTTDGDTLEEATRMAKGALLATIEILISSDEPVPLPSATSGTVIDLGTLVAAKITLNNLRVAAGLNRAQLSERLGGSPAQAYRTLSVLQNSRMDQIDRALAVLGYRGEFSAHQAAAE